MPKELPVNEKFKELISKIVHDEFGAAAITKTTHVKSDRLITRGVDELNLIVHLDTSKITGDPAKNTGK